MSQLGKIGMPPVGMFSSSQRDESMTDPFEEGDGGHDILLAILEYTHALAVGQ